MSCVLASENRPVAVKPFCDPIGIVAPEGATEMDETVAFVTVKFVVPVTVPRVAVTIVVPELDRACPVAMPLPPIVATVGSDEDQVTCVVRLRVPPSLNVPVALNCVVVPCAMVAFAGVIVMDARFAAFTVSDALPLTPPMVAEMVVVPIFKPVASPLTVIDAIPPLDDFHVTTPVTSCTLPSEKVPVAVNCCESPNGIFGFAGVTTIELITAAVTVKVVDPETVPEVAVITLLPAASAFASPCVGVVVLIVATAVFAELQVALPVRFCVLPSLYDPIARNCSLVPGATAGVAGVTVIDTRITCTVTVRFDAPLTFPILAVILKLPPATAVTNPPGATVAKLGFDELHVAALVKSFVVPLL